MTPSSGRRLLAKVLYLIMAVVLGFMIYSMVKGDTNWRYGAIAIVVAVLAKAAERLDRTS